MSVVEYRSVRNTTRGRKRRCQGEIHLHRGQPRGPVHIPQSGRRSLDEGERRRPAGGARLVLPCGAAGAYQRCPGDRNRMGDQDLSAPAIGRDRCCQETDRGQATQSTGRNRFGSLIVLAGSLVERLQGNHREAGREQVHHQGDSGHPEQGCQSPSGGDGTADRDMDQQIQGEGPPAPHPEWGCQVGDLPSNYTIAPAGSKSVTVRGRSSSS